MNHVAMVIGNPPHDGTPVEMALACLRFLEKRMATFLFTATHDHQGKADGHALDSRLLFCTKEAPVRVVASTEWDHRNVALSWIRANHPGTDRVWIVDTDEFYFEKDFDALLSTVEATDFDIWQIYRYAYWRDVFHRIEKPEAVPVTFCIDPSRVPAFYWIRTPFWEVGKPRCGIIQEGTIYQHHLTTVRTLDGMRAKWASFSHGPGAPKGAVEDRGAFLPTWIEQTWLGWHPDMRDLHPTIPEAWEKAVEAPAEEVPEACRNLLLTPPLPACTPCGT